MSPAMIVPSRERGAPPRRAVFKTAFFPLARRIKTIRARYAQNLQITRGLLRPSASSLRCAFKHARAINPAGRAANRGKHFILFSMPTRILCLPRRGVAWKMLTEWKTGRQRTGRPITRTNGPPSSPPGVNEGSAMHFCIRSTVPTTSRPFPVLVFLKTPVLHPCHNARLSPINRPSYFKPE